MIPTMGSWSDAAWSRGPAVLSGRSVRVRATRPRPESTNAIDNAATAIFRASWSSSSCAVKPVYTLVLIPARRHSKPVK